MILWFGFRGAQARSRTALATMTVEGARSEVITYTVESCGGGSVDLDTLHGLLQVLIVCGSRSEGLQHTTRTDVVNANTQRSSANVNLLLLHPTEDRPTLTYCYYVRWQTGQR